MRGGTLALLATSATLAAGVSGERVTDCARHGIDLHRGSVPWRYMASTDPSVPFPEELFDYHNWAHHSPHGQGVAHSEVDRMRDSLCSLSRKALSPEGLSEGDTVQNLAEVLIGAEETRERHWAAQDRIVRDGLSARKGTIDPEAEEVVHGDEAVELLETGGGEVAENAPDGQRQYQATSAKMSLATFVSLKMEGSLPIPALPILKVGLATAGETIYGYKYRYISLKAETQIGIELPPAKPLLNVFVTIAGKARVSASSFNAQQGSDVHTPGMLVKGLQYGIYANADAVQRGVNSSVAAAKEAMGITDTNLRKSWVLGGYARDFNDAIIKPLEDKIAYVTGGNMGGNPAAASNLQVAESVGNQPGLPSRAVIDDALQRIGKMVREVTPQQRGDGSLVWEYDHSSNIIKDLLTTELLFRLDRNGRWTWSPDNSNWMPTNNLVVSGGRWRGQRPTQDNQRMIRAIHTVFVDLARRAGAVINIPRPSRDALTGDPCDCRTRGRRIGSYNPHKKSRFLRRADVCHDWDRSGHDWCYVNNGELCTRSDIRQDPRHSTVFRRKCGIMASFTQGTNKLSRYAKNVVGSVDQTLTKVVNCVRAKTCVEQNANAVTNRNGKPVGNGNGNGSGSGSGSGSLDIQDIQASAAQAFGGDRQITEVFKEIAETLRSEGKGGGILNNVAARATQGVVGDFTRAVGIRGALYAFAKKNGGAREAVQQIRTIMAKQGPVATNVDGTAANGKVDTPEPIDKTAFRDGGKPAGAALAPQVGDINMNEVNKKMSEEQDNNPQQNLDEDNAKELYAVLAEQLVERHEHIVSLAELEAERTKAWGSWSRVNDAQKREVAQVLTNIRRNMQEIMGMLNELNEGNNFFQRWVGGGLDAIAARATSATNSLKAKMKAEIGRVNWKIKVKAYMTVQLGTSGKTPSLPMLPGGVKATLEVGGCAGVASVISTQKLDDNTKTYSSAYYGYAFDIGLNIKNPTGPPKMVFTIRREQRQLQDAHYRRNEYRAQNSATEYFSQTLILFPGNFGLSKKTIVPFFRGAMGATVLNNIFKNELAAESDDARMQEFTPDNGSSAPVANDNSSKFGEFFKAILPSDDREEGGRSPGQKILNFMQNYAPAVIAMAVPVPTGQLGCIGFIYDVTVDGRHKMKSAFFMPFFKRDIKSGLGLIPRITNLLPGADIEFFFDYGPSFLIRFGEDWVMNAPEGGTHDETARTNGATTHTGMDSPTAPAGPDAPHQRWSAERNLDTAATYGTNRAVALAVGDSSGPSDPCDQTFLVSQMSTIRDAVSRATPGSKDHTDLLKTLKDIKEFERGCVHRRAAEPIRK